MLTTIEESSNLLEPIFGSRYLQTPIPKFALPEKEMSKEAAYQIVHDELLFDGNPRLNLASFVTTWMEPECDKLIMESLNKNFIDYDEYPATLDIQDRCVNMLARLFHAPLKDNEAAVGTSTIGSSEAIMLAGLAMKRKWQQRRKEEGKSYDKPNMIAGSNVQVCWEKFARYFEVELREVKLQEGQFVMDPVKAVELVDENTILVCAILGSTYNGEFEDVKMLNDLLLDKNKITGWNTPIHVDAASGGFIAPFIYPSLEWDFRLPLVKSINVSGHKYGLVYAGIGWAIWRSQDELPEDLIFHINYLGSDQPSFTLNFTKGASHVIAQYYQFLRLGFNGYKSIARSCQENAAYLTERIKMSGKFHVVSKAVGVPVVTFYILKKVGVSEYDVADRLRQYGWIVPAYTMAPDLQHLNVLRVVVREDFRRSQADKLILDLEAIMEHLVHQQRLIKAAVAATTDHHHDTGYMSEGHLVVATPPAHTTTTSAESTSMANCSRLGVMEQIQKLRARRNSKLAGAKLATPTATADKATPPTIESTLTHRHRHMLPHRHHLFRRRRSATDKHAAIC